MGALPSPFVSEAARERFLAAYAEWSRAWPVPCEERVVRTPHGETFARGSGPDGAPVVLLLPGAGATSLMWAPNVAALAQTHRVWALDGIADVGRSVAAGPLRTAEDYVAWLDAVGEALSPSPFALAGVSYGAWISARYALARPSRVSALAAIAPAGTVMPLGFGFVWRAVLCALPSPRFTRRFLGWLAQDMAEQDPVHFAERIDQAWLALRSFESRRLVAPNVLGDEQLRALPRRTLFVYGENERICDPRASVARIRAAAPDIETLIVPGAGHDVSHVAAGVVNERLRALFAPPVL